MPSRPFASATCPSYCSQREKSRVIASLELEEDREEEEGAARVRVGEGEWRVVALVAVARR